MSIHHLFHNERKPYGKLLKVTRQQAHLPLTLPKREGRDGIRHTLFEQRLELLQLLLQ